MTGCASEKKSGKFSLECISAVEGLVVENKKMAGGLKVAVLLLQLIAFKLARSVVKAVRIRSQKNDFLYSDS